MQHSELQLSQHDLAEAVLTCLAEMPDAEKLGAARCLRVLDTWAERIRDYTDPEDRPC